MQAYQILKVAGADVKQLLSMNACTPENFNEAREKGEDIFDGVGLGPVVKHYKKERRCNFKALLSLKSGISGGVSLQAFRRTGVLKPKPMRENSCQICVRPKKHQRTRWWHSFWLILMLWLCIVGSVILSKCCLRHSWYRGY